MQKTLLVGTCWAFWLIYVVATVKTDLRDGISFWPFVKMAVAAFVAGYVSSVLMRSTADDPDEGEESPWRPMPLLVKVVLATAFFTGGISMIALSLATSLFGVAGVVIGVACLPMAFYILVAGKYNPRDVP